eukprot:m.291746 g.291746  ORF g.291746 m.291746 type:complete len:129 (-) comp19984_c0_seq7:293-679(-)
MQSSVPEPKCSVDSIAAKRQDRCSHTSWNSCKIFLGCGMYYADKLLSVGGFLVFDDVQMPGVQEAVLFVLQNRHYAVVNCFDVEKRITILRKTQQDDRECVTALALVWVECMCVQCASILGAFVHSRW